MSALWLCLRLCQFKISWDTLAFKVFFKVKKNCIWVKCLIWNLFLKINFKKVVYDSFSFVKIGQPNENYRHCTPPNSEIICGRNVGTKVVRGMILFFEQKAMLNIWKTSWEPFRSYLLNSTANPAHLDWLCYLAGM